jgi:hypothetical protein
VQSRQKCSGIALPEGTPEDLSTDETVCGLGNRKNELVNDYFASTSVEASSGSKTPGMIVPAPVTIASAVFKTASSRIVLYQADMKWRIA